MQVILSQALSLFLHGTTARSVVAYAVGTHGLAQNCSPSKQLAAGTDYEAANIAAAIKAGYAVLISDYAGYTTGGTPTYMSGKSQGNALLDLVLAATQIPNVGISSTSKVGIWGKAKSALTLPAPLKLNAKRVNYLML